MKIKIYWTFLFLNLGLFACSAGVANNDDWHESNGNSVQIKSIEQSDVLSGEDVEYFSWMTIRESELCSKIIETETPDHFNYYNLLEEGDTKWTLSRSINDKEYSIKPSKAIAFYVKYVPKEDDEEENFLHHNNQDNDEEISLTCALPLEWEFKSTNINAITHPLLKDYEDCYETSIDRQECANGYSSRGGLLFRYQEQLAERHQHQFRLLWSLVPSPKIREESAFVRELFDLPSNAKIVFSSVLDEIFEDNKYPVKALSFSTTEDYRNSNFWLIPQLDNDSYLFPIGKNVFSNARGNNDQELIESVISTTKINNLSANNSWNVTEQEQMKTDSGLVRHWLFDDELFKTLSSSNQNGTPLYVHMAIQTSFFNTIYLYTFEITPEGNVHQINLEELFEFGEIGLGNLPSEFDFMGRKKYVH